MFDITKAVQKHQQLQADKINGLPSKSKEYQEFIQHIDDTKHIEQAEREGVAISRAFKSKTMDFGKRLKRTYKQGDDTFPTGEKHRLIGRNH